MSRKPLTGEARRRRLKQKLQWQIANRDKGRAADRRYYYAHHADNRARINARRKRDGRAKEVAYEKAHPWFGKARADRYNAKPGQKEKHKAHYKKWLAGPKGQAYLQRQRDRLALHVKLIAARRRAKENGLPFDVALLNMFHKVTPPLHCPACGKVLDYASRRSGGYHNNAPSPDRVVNALGYVVGNVAIICARCNAIKADATADELRAIAAYIDRHVQSSGSLHQPVLAAPAGGSAGRGEG